LTRKIIDVKIFFAKLWYRYILRKQHPYFEYLSKEETDEWFQCEKDKIQPFYYWPKYR